MKKAAPGAFEFLEVLVVHDLVDLFGELAVDRLLPLAHPVAVGDRDLPLGLGGGLGGADELGHPLLEPVQPAVVPRVRPGQVRVLLPVLRELLPGRDVVPISARELVLGLGAVHCLTQQVPAFHPEGSS